MLAPETGESTMNVRFFCGATSIALAFGLSATSGFGQAPPMDLSHYAPYDSRADVGDFILNPPYADAPELKRRADVPTGTVYPLTLDSEDSKIYPGIDRAKPTEFVPYHRRVSVYVPRQYVPGRPAPFLVAQDSLGVNEVPTILDNMIADHRVPVMVAVFIDSGGGDSKGSERGLEYDTLSGRYAGFIEDEVLPRLSKAYGITFTKDPEGRLAVGGSSGGACALSMAWYRTDLYHRVLSYSGTFVNQQWPYDPATPHGAWEYHEHLIPESKRKPLRIWMHVGENDLRQNDPESTYHNWPLANVRTAAVLKAKKYPYQFVFAKASGHVDGRVVRQTLPQALEWVWKGYRSPR